MINAILIGDSIRMGYLPFVQAELEGIASVWGPQQNGGTSENVLMHLDDWVLSRPAHVIHINAGLHDIKRPFDSTTNAVPLEQYRDNVEQTLVTIQEKTDARLIWATTTPVNQEWHHERKGFDRFEADVIAYNEVAREIAQRLGVQINDLFQVATSAGRDSLLAQDGVHFTEEGYALLGKKVAEAIR